MTVVAYGVDHGVDGLLTVVPDLMKYLRGARPLWLGRRAFNPAHIHAVLQII